MKMLATLVLLAASSFASAQSYRHEAGVTSNRYPVYSSESVPTEQCREVIVDERGRPLGLSRDDTSMPFRGHSFGRGAYYNDRGQPYRHYDTRIRPRHGITIVLPGARYGDAPRYIERECAPDYRRNVLIGWRVVYQYPNGRTEERFEPVDGYYGY